MSWRKKNWIIYRLRFGFAWRICKEIQYCFGSVILCFVRWFWSVCVGLCVCGYGKCSLVFCARNSHMSIELNERNLRMYKMSPSSTNRNRKCHPMKTYLINLFSSTNLNSFECYSNYFECYSNDDCSYMFIFFRKFFFCS